MLDLSKLNPSQYQAVIHPKGPAMILAGPGSGKTFLIVSRILYLLEYRKIPADSILVITFTRAAALSMHKRFVQHTNGTIYPVHFGTFHAVFYQILRQFDSYDTNSLLTPQEKQYYFERALRQVSSFLFNSLENRKRDKQSLLLLVEKYRHTPEKPITETLPEEVTVEAFRALCEVYGACLLAEKKMDFEDMGAICFKLLKEKPNVLARLQRQFTHILIDEYQDTNEQQDKIISLLTGNTGELFVVGDDDQSIYGFRGSTPDIMQRFLDKYPNCSLYRMEENYRSTGAIVEAAGKMIQENKQRFLKTPLSMQEIGEPVHYYSFPEKQQQCEFLVKRVKQMLEKYGQGEVAVITRGNKELEWIGQWLSLAGIPFWGGKERGKSFATQEFVEDFCQCLVFITEKQIRMPAIWQTLSGTERKKKIMAKQTAQGALHFFWKTLGYERYAKEKCNNQEQWEEWQELFAFLWTYTQKQGEIDRFLGEIHREKTKKPEKNWEKRQEKGVQLLTMHGSKGLEFSYVCIPSVNEGILPGKQCQGEGAVEEERRIFYVAMTRAKKVLDILYLAGTNEYPRLPSRFLNPLLPKG